MPNVSLYLSIVIPAYNEQNRIPQSLAQVFGFLAEVNYSSQVIVVDDGSIDETRNVLKFMQQRFPKLKVLQNMGNRGKGYSVRKGVLNSKGKYLLFSDADMSTPIHDVDKLLSPLQSGEYQITIGPRALDPMLIHVYQSLSAS